MTPAFLMRSCAAGARKNAVNASLDGAVPITHTLLGASMFLKASAVIPASIRAFPPVSNPDLNLSKSVLADLNESIYILAKLNQPISILADLNQPIPILADKK